MKDLLERCETEMRYAGWATLEVDNPQRQDLYFRVQAALAQPVQESDHGDELTIAYMSGVHRGKELAAQPAQTVSLTSARYIADEDDDIQVYKRPWVGLTDEEIESAYWDYMEIATQNGFEKTVKAIEAKLKEKNT